MDKKQIVFLIIIFFAIVGIVFPQPSVVQEILKTPIPPGFIYKNFKISPSGLKTFTFLQSQPGELTSDVAMERIFDANNNLVKEYLLTDSWILEGFTKNNNIILIKGHADYLAEARIEDLKGNLIFSFKIDGDRQLVEDLYGQEIALVATADTSFYQPSVVYDLRTGKEKFRFGPLSRDKYLKLKPAQRVPLGTKIFLPVGEENLFIIGMGATVLMQRYDRPGYLWKIDDVGGNIYRGKFLNEKYLAVSYILPGKKFNEFIEGLAIIEWRTGNIIFNLKLKDRKEIWSTDTYYTYLDRAGNLCFVYDEGKIVKMHFLRDKKSWDPKNIKIFRCSFGRSSQSGKGRPKVHKGEVYFGEEEGELVALKKINLTALEEEGD